MHDYARDLYEVKEKRERMIQRAPNESDKRAMQDMLRRICR